MSETKKSSKKSMDNRTTKTKASATKPQVFGLSLTRNKNNPNPILFNSVRKKSQIFMEEKQTDLLYRSADKQNQNLNKGSTLLQDLNTKISIDFMNSMYSDLGVRFGYQLKYQLENKQNLISTRNINVAIPSKQQKQCLDKIKSLINIKDQVNQSYKSMKNSQNVFTYLANKQRENNVKVQIRNTDNINDVHRQILSFLRQFQSKQHQLEQLQSHYEQLTKKVGENQEVMQDLDQNYLDSIIQSLKEEIAHQKRLCLRYEKQEKFLINKLYSTQRKNNQLALSSTNLKIKNTNLKDTIRFSFQKSNEKHTLSPKLHRSFSVKLQRIKKYNLDDGPSLINQNQGTGKCLIRSKSTSSFNSMRQCSNFDSIRKDNFLDKII